MLISTSFLSLCVYVNPCSRWTYQPCITELSHKGSIFAFPISRVKAPIHSEAITGSRTPTFCWKLVQKPKKWAVYILYTELYTHYTEIYRLKTQEYRAEAEYICLEARNT
uniref:Secreted protein n=1 Tax=Solanum tuberosum TaxID=4113 RepID=M1CVT7_SOLTU